MRTGGRKRGTPNRRTQAVIERLEALSCDPLEGMVQIAQQAQQEGDLSLAGAMFKELAQYIYPKRKAIEVQEHSIVEQVGIRVVGVVPEWKKDDSTLGGGGSH